MKVLGFPGSELLDMEAMSYVWLLSLETWLVWIKKVHRVKYKLPFKDLVWEKMQNISMTYLITY
jgi:hypothetical protein